ncbi:MAG: PqqD family protein [Clostridia bacterium]
MKLSAHSILKMHPLQQRKENEEEILIGRPDISNFIILPAFAVEIIEMLDGGNTIEQVEEEMEQRFGEKVDVMSFADDLINEYQFVHLLDNQVVNEKLDSKDHFSWISANTGKLLFNRTAYTVYGLIILSGIGVLIISSGKYFPVYSDIFISSSLTLSLIIAILMGWVFVFIHELAHLMSARSLGIGSRIGLSHRLFFPVAETNMSNIVLIPPQNRYRAYFAGMAWDGVFFSIGMWLLFFADRGVIPLSPAGTSFIKILNLTFLETIAFQFMFFMRTDIYYAFTTKFQCNNLLENTQLFLHKLYRSLNDTEKAVWNTISPHEKNIIRWYSLFYVGGIVWAVFFFLAYNVRQVIDFVLFTWEIMTTSSIGSWVFVDAVILIGLALLPFGVLLWSWYRTLKNRYQERKRKRVDQSSSFQ